MMRALLLLIAMLVAAPAAAQEAAPITLGATYTLDSAVMEGERTVNVYLPASYAAEPERRYPVLYLLDGGVDQDFVHVVGTTILGAIWGRNAEVIVVGVASVDRRNEFTERVEDAELAARYPTAGQSDRFRRFLREEVKPFVAGRYRTDGTDGVLGESAAGLFIAETWLVEPDLFTSYAAISPSLWWDGERLSHRAASLVGAGQRGHRLLVIAENEGAEYRAPVDRYVAALSTASGWCYIPRNDLNHANVYHAVTPTALQFLFPPAQTPDPSFGFTVDCVQQGPGAVVPR